MAEPLRGQGFGTRLLLAAEAEAQTKGGEFVILETHSFQARPFYEQHGYTVIAEIPDYPRSHSWYILRKALF